MAPLELRKQLYIIRVLMEKSPITCVYAFLPSKDVSMYEESFTAKLNAWRRQGDQHLSMYWRLDVLSFDILSWTPFIHWLVIGREWKVAGWGVKAHGMHFHWRANIVHPFYSGGKCPPLPIIWGAKCPLMSFLMGGQMSGVGEAFVRTPFYTCANLTRMLLRVYY